MTIAERCASCFEAEIWARGFSIYEQGQVKVTHANAALVMATVASRVSPRCDVVLDFDGRTLEIEATCTCQDYSIGRLCHHIWATILAVDEMGWLQDGPPLPVELIVSHQDVSIEPDHNLSQTRHHMRLLSGSVHQLERRRALLISRRQALRPPPHEPSGPTWQAYLLRIQQQTTQRHLRRATAPSNAALPPRRAWYVCNVERSLKAGGLVLAYHHQERLANGTLGPIKARGIARSDVPAYETLADQRLLHLLLGQPTDRPESSASAASPLDPERATHCLVAPVLYDHLVPELCATGRLIWLPSATTEVCETQNLAWDAGAPWQFKVCIFADDAHDHWRLEGQLVRGEQEVALSEAVLLLADGLVLFPGHIGRLAAGDDFGWIATLRQAGDLRIPYEDRDAFLQMWWSAPALPLAALPAALDLPTEPSVPTATFTVLAPTQTQDRHLHAKVTVHYGDHTADPETFQVGIVELNPLRVIRRDREAETAWLSQLADLGVHRYSDGPRDASYRFPSAQLSALTDALLQSGWVVEAEGVRFRPPGAMTFEVRSGTDWFELHGQVDFGGFTVALPTLLRARRSGERYVLLGDGSRGMLPETWLARYGHLADLGESDAENLRFKPSQALLLDALLAEQEGVCLDPGFERSRDRLRTLSGIEPALAPVTFEGQLRPYQQEGLGWLYFLRDFHLGGCLADDMGLGKTIQVLALLASRRDSKPCRDHPPLPSIVVVPRSLVFNWLLEAARFTPTLRVSNYTGPNRSQALAQLGDTDVLVTTYGTLRRDILSLKAIAFDYAILDEAQAIKNANSQTAKASRLLQAKHRLALSGTPVENHLGDLWSLFEFLNPGMLGRSSVFNQMSKTGESQDDAQVSLLATALRPLMLRRTKTQVLSDLPDKTEQTLYCDLPHAQRQLYDELRDYYRRQLSEQVQAIGLKRSKIQILEALLRLRQAACHPGLIDVKRAAEPSAKTEALLEQLESVTAEGHKALVFSQFTSLLAIVRKRLDERGMVYAYLDGRTRKRQERVEQFQQDAACPLFLISLKAGGHGLNLTAADYVFILDPWWNPAVEAQAIDRAHRLGQTRPVFAYRLISRDTVEDKIVALQQSKRELAESIVAADANLMRHLTAEDLQLLIS